ncbi:MAG: hypothetical protein HAW66_05050 [Shewanella sp.]|nr:hypothetical protein [Shewanella sp.]
MSSLEVNVRESERTPLITVPEPSTIGGVGLDHGGVRYVVVQTQNKHPFLQSPCCVSGCVPTCVFGSFMGPYVKIGADTSAVIAGSKYLIGGATGTAVGLGLGYVAYKLYNRVWPSKLQIITPLTVTVVSNQPT